MSSPTRRPQTRGHTRPQTTADYQNLYRGLFGVDARIESVRRTPGGGMHIRFKDDRTVVPDVRPDSPAPPTEPAKPVVLDPRRIIRRFSSSWSSVSSLSSLEDTDDEDEDEDEDEGPGNLPQMPAILKRNPPRAARPSSVAKVAQATRNAAAPRAVTPRGKRAAEMRARNSQRLPARRRELHEAKSAELVYRPMPETEPRAGTSNEEQIEWERESTVTATERSTSLALTTQEGGSRQATPVNPQQVVYPYVNESARDFGRRGMVLYGMEGFATIAQKLGLA